MRTSDPPTWSDCAGLSLELRLWHLQFGNSSIDSDGRLWHCRTPPATALQPVVLSGECRGFIHQYQDSILAGHLGVSRTVCRLLDRVYWPGIGCLILFGQLFSMLGAEISVSSPCAYGTCFRWSPVGLGGHIYSRHVCYHGKG